jgi:Tol biopolymer transport system component
MFPSSLSRRDWLRLGGAVLCGSALGFAPSDDGDRKGRIYLTADLGMKDENDKPTQSLIAIDPETGESMTIFSGCQTRPRVSPDGRKVAYVWDSALWVRPIDAGAGLPLKLMDVEDTSACSPVWSSDNKKLIVSPGKRDDAADAWRFKSVRIKVDGAEVAPLAIPAEDCVADWTPDEALVVTASSRNAEIGWQLYVMKPDGTGARQITEGGNPFYARLSPDGKKLLYADGTSDERRGIWVSDLAGKDRKRVLPTAKECQSSASFSPDGKRIAVILFDFNGQQRNARLEIVELETGNSKQFPLPDGAATDTPDWR